MVLSVFRLVMNGALKTAFEGHLHLHPISQTHQFRPTLTYMDVFHRKNRRRANGDDDSDSDDGPPPDPDDPNPPAQVKKEPKAAGEAKEVTVSLRKTDDKGMGAQSSSSGMSAVRREMMQAIREEEDEPWQELKYCDGEVMVLLVFTSPALTSYFYRAKSLLKRLTPSSRGPNKDSLADLILLRY